MDGPKPAFVIDKEPWWNFLFEYDFEGATYEFTVPARSYGEASERMKKIALARFVGQAHGKPIPASRGWWVPFWVWWKNVRRT